MAIVDWLKKHLAGDDKAKLVISDDEEVLSGLNMKEVLDAHNAWKKMLEEHLKGDNSSNMDISKVSQDDQCDLGRWLHGYGKKHYSKLPEYQTTVLTHANFHICAGEVLIEHQSGNTKTAESLLKGKFRTISNKNQLELVRLFVAAKS